MKTRKSKNCLKWCDTKNCYDTFEQRLINEKPCMVWVSHCKKRDILHKELIAVTQSLNTRQGGRVR